MPSARFAKISNAYGVGMLDRRGRLSLAFKSGDRLAFLQVFAAEDVLANGLDRYAACVEFRVASKIDLAHRPAAETAFEKIAFCEQLCAGQREARLRLIGRTQHDIIRIARLAFGALSHLINDTKLLRVSHGEKCRDVSDRTYRSHRTRPQRSFGQWFC